MTLDRWRASRSAWASPTARSGTSSRASPPTPAELQALPRRRAVQRRGPPPHRRARRSPIPAALPQARRREVEHAGRLRQDPDRHRRASDSELAERIVTTSPDVTVSTNLGAWVNRRGLFGHTEAEDVFRELKVVSAAALAQDAARASTSSSASPRTTCSSMLAALGLSAPAVRRAAAADRHALRSLHRRAASMR